MHSHSSLFESLFKRNNSDEGNVAFLEDVAKRYPYFAAAQFFLLQHTDLSSSTYNEQAARTGLLFNDPLWLNFQLKPEVEQLVDAAIGEPTPEALAIIPEQEEVKLPEPEKVSVATSVTEPTTETVGTNHETEEITLSEPGEVQEPAPEMKAAIEMKLAAPIIGSASSKHEGMLFEPMHMVDYFASQGIKLSEEIQTGDKLGKQLKSFTEWLKTMKKVHNDKSGENETNADITVQTLAERSNTEDEVVTESMAEVFAMQGKIKKAIETYKKLSLLNPAKSAFFAAKIEQLKG